MYYKKVKKIRIKKKNGGKRIVYAPQGAYKSQLRLMVSDLNRRVKEECDPEIVHGFALGKSPITNAMAHRGFQYTLSVDIEDFFDNIKDLKFIGGVGKDIYKYDICAHAGTWAPQGFPTSPAISNLACIEMDKVLKVYCGENIVYTRYADDLSFSCNNVEILKELRTRLPDILGKFGFKLNDNKTRIQWAGFGRRNITGVMVDDKIHISRSTKRKLRAALHQRNTNSAKGLQEWSKLKLPNPNGSERTSRVKKTEHRHIARKIQGVPDLWE